MDLLKLGAEVKVYSRSQGRLCPAKIIGLEGDLSQHQLAKSGEKIGRGWVEVKYMPPCPSITKNVKIGDIKYDPSLLPSPPREEAVRRVQRDSRNPCIGVRDGTLHPGCPQERPICMKSNCSERTVDSARCGRLFFCERWVRVMLSVDASTTSAKNCPVWSLERCPPGPPMRSFRERG